MSLAARHNLGEPLDRVSRPLVGSPGRRSLMPQAFPTTSVLTVMVACRRESRGNSS